jgi:hypothetical protein
VTLPRKKMLEELPLSICRFYCLELSRALGRLFRRMFLPASRMREPSPRGPLFCDNYSIQSQIRESDFEAKPWKVLGCSGQDPLS